MRSKFGGTEYSRRKEEERERKIAEFQMAIQRQGRSLKKLLEEKQSLSVSQNQDREVQWEHQLEKSMQRRAEQYHRTSERKECRNPMESNELDYLQSSHYEKYLQQIMAGHSKQIDNSKKIDIIRSKNIYLQQHFKPSNQSTQQKKDKNMTKLEQRMKQQSKRYNKGPNNNICFYEKDTSKLQSSFFPTITCLPYLENSSISLEINDHKDNEMSEVSTTEPTCWNEPLKNITIFHRNERRLNQDLQNVKTVAKRNLQNPTNQQMLRPPLQVNSQTKQERNLFIEDMLRQQKENKQEISLKTPQPRNKHTINQQNQARQSIKTPMKRSNLSQTNQRQSRPNTSFTQITTKNQDNSLYTVEFKLERPDESRRVVRSSSAIGMTEDRCYLTNKSQKSMKSQFLRPS